MKNPWFKNLDTDSEFALICAPYNAKKSCYSLNMTLDGPNITVQVYEGHGIIRQSDLRSFTYISMKLGSFEDLSLCTISKS